MELDNSRYFVVQIRALERAKSSGNFSGVSISQFDYDKDEEEEAADDSEMASGQSEPQKKKVKL